MGAPRKVLSRNTLGSSDNNPINPIRTRWQGVVTMEYSGVKVDVDLVEVGSGDSGSPRNQSGVCCNNCSIRCRRFVSSLLPASWLEQWLQSSLSLTAYNGPRAMLELSMVTLEPNFFNRRCSLAKDDRSASWLPKHKCVIPILRNVVIIPFPPSIEDNVEGDKKSPASTTNCGWNWRITVWTWGNWSNSYTSLNATIRNFGRDDNNNEDGDDEKYDDDNLEWDTDTNVRIDFMIDVVVVVLIVLVHLYSYKYLLQVPASQRRFCTLRVGFGFTSDGGGWVSRLDRTGTGQMSLRVGSPRPQQCFETNDTMR